MKNSLKQLLRTPVKSLIFFLLIAACSLLLVFGSVLLYQSSRRLAAVEQEFTTIGTISTPLLEEVETGTVDSPCQGELVLSESIWAEEPKMDAFNFEGADYLIPPESRPYYAAYLPEMEQTWQMWEANHLLEFTALEDDDGTGPVDIRVERVLYTFDYVDIDPSIFGLIEPYSSLFDPAEEGAVLRFCQCLRFPDTTRYTPLEKGKRYIAGMAGNTCTEHMLGDGTRWEEEDIWYSSAYSTQHSPDGSLLNTGVFPSGPDPQKTVKKYVEEVTDNFYDEGQPGQKWLNAAKNSEMNHNLFLVEPARSMQTMPTFHDKEAYISEGREITQEEFETGANVCLVPQNLALANQLKVGDKLTLPLLCSLYGYDLSVGNDTSGMYFNFTLLNADGEIYEPFWEAEYEIVGFYATNTNDPYEKGELTYDLLIIPMSSVRASDENNIAYYGKYQASSTTFQIPNGSIETFAAALRETVPEAAELEITYSDNGYEEVAGNLHSVQLTAILLFTAGLLAAGAVIALLLYFFVAKEKKRTAIERSLGMTRNQCRISILAGLLAFTLAAAFLGGAGGIAVTQYANPLDRDQVAEVTLSQEEEAELASQAEGSGTWDSEKFSVKYSPWAQSAAQTASLQQDVASPPFLYALPPLALVLAVFLLSLFLVNRNLRTDPMLLLGGKNE